MDPHSIEAEENLLGAILTVPAYLSGILAEVQLHADHFYFARHGLIFAAIVALYDRGDPVDEITVGVELEKRDDLEKIGGRNRLAELSATVKAPGNALHYAKIIVGEAEWRSRREAGQGILEAVAAKDMAALASAEEKLSQDFTHAGSDFSPQRQADVAYAMLDQGGVEAFPWPFEKLNQITSGGLRRGELAVIAGHTSHGKSVVLDQTLESCAKRGARCRLYMNEMALDERVARTLTRRTEVPYGRLLQGRLSEEDRGKVVAELNRGFPYPITYAPGWTAADLSHHVRAHRPDVAAIDILQEIDYADERDLSRIISTFARTAKQAGCALIVTSHLNERRVEKAVRPRPTIGDLRGSGQIKNAADSVLFVYREQNEETGEPQSSGSLYFGKARNSAVGGMRVTFNGKRLRFEVTG